MPSSHCRTIRLRYVKYKGMVCVLGEMVDKNISLKAEEQKAASYVPKCYFLPC